MIKKRVPVPLVLLLSVLLAVLCLGGGVWMVWSGIHAVWTWLLLGLGLWFGVDAFRSWRWMSADAQANASEEPAG